MTEHRRELRGAPAADLALGVRKGDHRAIAEALTRVEDARPAALAAQRELLAELARDTPREHTVVGLTGPPGAGKSSLASALIARLSARGEGVGMTAIDPSSQRSGGALLGDRARVHVPEGARVFIRSMAARDRLGGLAPATRAAVVVLRAAFPWVLVETVGVGQSEIDVASVADSIVLVVQPGSGDTLQFMKAGVLEIPDLLVVHKWDLGLLAEQALADLRAFLSLRPRQADWDPPLLGVSSHTGYGLEELEASLREHRAFLAATGELDARRERARVAWALELFCGRYGGLGLERLGGRDAARQLVRTRSDTALDAFIRLATRAALEPEPRPT